MKPLFILIMLTLANTIYCSDDKVKLPIVYKCCSITMLVGNGSSNVCMNSDKPFNFTRFPIFGYEEGKTLYDMFNIVPGKFNTDEGFHNDAIISLTPALRNFKPLLNENGILYLELPNAFRRWTKIDTNNFCIDFYLNRFGNVLEAFWIKQNDEPQDKNDDFLTAAMLISCFFLLIVLIVYALLAELRNLCGLILMAYVLSLLAALLHLGVLRIKNYDSDICYRLTLVIYFSFMASFCWMNVMSYDIWWTFRTIEHAKASSENRRRRRGVQFKFLMYCLYAWGLPMALTTMMAWIDSQNLTDKPWFVKPNLRFECFIQGGEKLYYLYMPMLILICINCIFYMLTAFNIWQLSRGTSVLDSAGAGTLHAHRNHRQRFLIYLKLSVVMGLNWILEVVSFLTPEFFGWYIVDLYNILVGVSIFLIFVCKRKILRKLANFINGTQNKSQWYPETLTRETSAADSSVETQTQQVCTNPNGPGYLVNNF